MILLSLLTFIILNVSVSNAEYDVVVKSISSSFFQSTGSIKIILFVPALAVVLSFVHTGVLGIPCRSKPPYTVIDLLPIDLKLSAHASDSLDLSPVSSILTL